MACGARVLPFVRVRPIALCAYGCDLLSEAVHAPPWGASCEAIGLLVLLG